MAQKFSDFTDVFVSYRRKDVEFAKELVQILKDEGKDVWIDWEDIPPGSVGFEYDIKRGLEGADAFICVLSPDYLESTYCVDVELRYAIELKKKLIPVVLRKFDDHMIPQGIGHINWIYFTPHAGQDNTFEESMPKVLQALALDQQHIRNHKRLLVRALEWESNNRQNSYLLNGKEIEQAEQWMTHAADKDPEPIQLHHEYIFASRNLTTKRQRQLLLSVSGALLITILLTITTVIQWSDANKQRNLAETNWEIALTNEANAVSAEATAVRNFEISRSIALAGGAQEINTLSRADAVGLARESVSIENPPRLAQRVFRDIVLQPNITHILQGHNAGVRAVDFSPDGSQIVSGSEDGTIKIWDAVTGAEIQTLTGHTDEVNGVTYNPDGTQIVSASRDKTLIIWDASTGEALHILEGHADRVNGVAYSPDGTTVASAGRDGVLKLWNTATGVEIRTFEGHTDRVFAVAYSPDGTQLISGGRDETLILWDVESGESLRTFDGHRDTILAVAFSPQGNRVASASSDNTIGIWDIETGEQLETLTEHSGIVRSLDYSADGQLLASGSDDLSVIIWNADGNFLERYVGLNTFIRSVAFAPDGNSLAVGDTAANVTIWRTVSGNFAARYTDHTQRVNGLSVSGDMLASASDDGSVMIRKVSDGEIIQTFLRHQANVNSAQFSADGQVIVSGDRNGMVILWNTINSEIIQIFEGHTNPVFSVAVSADGTRILSGGGVILSAPELFWWDAETGERLLSLEGHTDVIRAVAISPDGKTLASGGSDNLIYLWDAETGEIQSMLSGHEDWVQSLSFSPDGKTLLSAAADSRIILWEVANGEEIAVYAGHSAGIRGVAFGPDGRYFASASDDNTVLLWSVNDAEPIGVYQGHIGDVNTVTFGTDNVTLFSGGEDGQVIQWQVRTLQDVIAWAEANVYIGEVGCDIRRQLGISELSTDCSN